MMYEIGSGGMKRVDVHENDRKNRLDIGTVLHFSGYGDKDYVIVANLGISGDFPFYGASYKMICREDYREMQTRAFTMKHISEKKDARIQIYYTDETVSTDEVLDLIDKAKKAKELKAQQEKEKQEHTNAKKQGLLNKYPYLETVQNSKKSRWSLGASNLRKELKRAFPGIKFKVTSKSYSMGCSIDASWTDGPLDEEVERYSDKYQYGHFDGMTDCYNYHQNYVWDEVFGGAKYVFANRHVSDELINKASASFGCGKYDPGTGAIEGADWEKKQIILRKARQTRG